MSFSRASWRREPKVGLVHQSGGVERLAGLFSAQLLSCQLAQLVIDQRQELLGRRSICLVNGAEDTGRLFLDKSTFGTELAVAGPCGFSPMARARRGDGGPKPVIRQGNSACAQALLGVAVK